MKMKLGRDIWMNPSSYEAASKASCLYKSSSHPRYRKKDSLEARRTSNSSKSKSTHRGSAPRSPTLWSQMLNFTSNVRHHSLLTIIMDTFVYAIVIVACIACYANSLDGEFVHDDLVSITMNPDVIGENPVKEIFLNDFWGKPMTDPTSHKSYRPFTVLTFR
ncbi:hypothetical protein TNIN_14821 [Trichonephila inaurata madagascariensis]|uniref:Transmembrane and TPR repeat-containing protein 3 n=1 Tax=Trichonephila inaurata madagascariensis TaxID=2747483 RepID=A0A8X6XJ90_9ARAC|nr:hypothetical protein TNIN_14821 [Trichonephila inaurata madagascariensis]